MSKKEFLKKLGKELGTLPSSEREKTLAYYDELIEDRKESGATEEAAVYAMGDIKTIAAEILSDAKERGVELKKRGMPTFVKVLLISLAVIVLAAGVAFGVELLREFRLVGSAPEWEKVEKEFGVGSKEKIDLDMTTCDLVIMKSQDDKIRVTYYANDALLRWEVKETDEALTVTQRHKGMLFGFLYPRERRSASLFVPEGFTGILNAKTTTGSLSLEGIQGLQSLNLSATTGSLAVYNANADYALFRVTTGDMSVNSCEIRGDMTASGTAGDTLIIGVKTVQLKVVRTTGDVIVEKTEVSTLDASLTTGDLDIKTVTAKTASLHTTTGRISINGLSAEEASISSSTGDIKFDKLETKTLEMSASTGDVKGTLTGKAEDYTFETHTSTGKNSLPESFGFGEKKVKIKTSTGDIDVKFEHASGN